MSIHPLVAQLRFARSEFLRCLNGVSAEDALRRLDPMNCLSWMLGHMASQEQAYWVLVAQGRVVVPDLHKLVGSGHPPSSPPLEEMRAAWQSVTQAADEFLDTLTTERVASHLVWKEKPRPESTGTLLYRNIYHYWFHTGEAHAVRQMLGHQDLPQFVGDMAAAAAVYRPE